MIKLLKILEIKTYSNTAKEFPNNDLLIKFLQSHYEEFVDFVLDQDLLNTKENSSYDDEDIRDNLINSYLERDGGGDVSFAVITGNNGLAFSATDKTSEEHLEHFHPIEFLGKHFYFLQYDI